MAHSSTVPNAPSPENDTENGEVSKCLSSASPYTNNPSLVAPVRVNCSVSHEQRDRQLLIAVYSVHPELFGDAYIGSCSKSDSVLPVPGMSHEMVVKTLAGGLSNALFVLTVTNLNKTESNPSTRGESVLIRVHFGGENIDKGGEETLSRTTMNPEDKFVDRERELAALCHLSKNGLAPALLGRFENGRVEEFYNDARPLRCSEMRVEPYLTGVARAIGRLHRQDVPVEPQGSSMAECWNKIDRWFHLAEEMVHSNGQTLESMDVRLEKLDVFGKMLSEWTWLKQSLRDKHSPTGGEAGKFAKQVVFTHMDCQPLNILTSPEWVTCPALSLPVRLIDFEYAGYNPRAVDLGNTFCEFCDMTNFEAEYNRQYPTDGEQDAFLEAYVRETDPELARSLDNVSCKPSRTESSWNNFLASLRSEIGRHALVSHVMWAVWAVSQSMLSPIEYDYVRYAEERMKGYHYFKEVYWE